MTGRIRSITTGVPLNQSSSSKFYRVGANGVSKIVVRDDRNLTWFDVYQGDDLSYSANALWVAEVQWEGAL